MEEEKKKEEKINHDPSKTRFSGAEWFKAGPQEIIIGGVGGIGSWLAFWLSRIGHDLYLFDGDTIDDVNLAGQFYKKHQLGELKVVGVKDNINQFCTNNININTWYDKDSIVTPIMFSAFDNMEARKLMFQKWKDQEDREVFIDGRLLMEIGMVYCVQKGEEDLYESELFDDSEVEDAACNYKATTHCGAFIASLMTSVFNNWLANKQTGIEMSFVQFRTDFELPMLTLTEVKVQLPVNEILEETIETIEHDK